jgi:hypothetical protein
VAHLLDVLTIRIKGRRGECGLVDIFASAALTFF